MLEYGFNFSATREIARFREDHQMLTDIVNNVQGAKLILIFCTVLLSVIALYAFSVFRIHSEFLIWTLALSLVQGLSPLWYYQGIENLRLPARIDTISGILYTLFIIYFIRKPEDGILVLFFKFLFSLGSLGITTSILYKNIKFKMPRWNDSVKALKMGLSMFFFRSSVSLYTTANTLILGFLAPLNQVAFYAGAEKIGKVSQSLMNPITQAIFPRMNNLFKNDVEAAHKLGILSLSIMTLFGILGGLITYFFAPLLVKIILGNGYEGAISVLRILFLLIPLVAISNVLGLQYMIPLKMDSHFNIILMLAGFINIALAYFLTRLWGIQGMAIGVVLSESFVTFSMLIVLLKSNKLFFNPKHIPGIKNV